jgi:hypothetical protein
MEDQLQFFLGTFNKIEAVFHKRAEELGVVRPQGMTSSPEQLVAFASELKKRTDKIFEDRKKK